MNIENAVAALNQQLAGGVDVYERRPGRHQLIVPILHEDGDMVDIYLQSSPLGDGHIRICDFGMTLMRLSYTFDETSLARSRILDSILINNDIRNDAGNLYLDTPADALYRGVLQFAGCVQKVCNMRYWAREVPRSTFYDDLGEYVTTELAPLSPVADFFPLSDYPVGVDWSLTHNDRALYLFGVRGNDKAKNVAISLLEFQKARLLFISLIVHEDMSELGGREMLYLTRNADLQYPVLSDFMQKAIEDVERIAAEKE